MSNNDFLNITTNINIIEELKLNLLKEVTNLYDELRKPKINSDRKEKALSEILLSTYLLAYKLGIEYEELDNVTLASLKIKILENKDNLYYPASNLYKHIMR